MTVIESGAICLKQISWNWPRQCKCASSWKPHLRIFNPGEKRNQKVKKKWETRYEDEEAFNGGPQRESYERKRIGRMPKCGRSHRPRQHPAYGQTCHKCGQQNHFARKCRLGDGTHMVDGHQSEEDEEDLMQTVVQKMGLMAKMQLEWNRKNVELDCQVDTAASCNVLTYSDYCRLGNQEMKKSKTVLIMYDGQAGSLDLSLFPVIFGHLSDVGVDHRNHVIIQCDVSTVGLGATLLQDGRPVASASRSLTKSEKNYLALELECLTIVFACQKFDQYIYSKPVRVETDHKPLEVIAKKSILSAPRRLQRMLLQPQRYNLDIVYLPGEQQVVADVLSRAPVEQPRGEQLGKAEVFQIVDQELAVIQEREFVSDAKMAAVRSAAVQGQEQAALRQIICQGWSPNIKQLPATVKAYWNFRDTMTVQDGIVYKGGQAVVPKELRKEFLQRLHSSHQGSQLTLKGARVSYSRLSHRLL
ncbi:hypothetical protein EMCRGX_G011418 [Ephydatia muelleri]